MKNEEFAAAVRLKNILNEELIMKSEEFAAAVVNDSSLFAFAHQLRSLHSSFFIIRSISSNLSIRLSLSCSNSSVCSNSQTTWKGM